MKGVTTLERSCNSDADLHNNGTLGLCTGPAWLNHLNRTVGAPVIENYQGVWVNAIPIDCTYDSTGDYFGCAPQFCTYLGTMYATANGQTSMQFGPNGTLGGPCNVLGLWNAYNRVHAFSVARDLSLPWAQGTASTWEPADPSRGGGLCNRVTFVDGLQQSNINTVETQQIAPGEPVPKPMIGVVLDSTSAPPLSPAEQANSATGSVAYSNWSAPLLGLHYAQAMENAAGTALVFNPGLSLQLNWEY